MVRLRHSVTGVVIVVDEATADSLDGLWVSPEEVPDPEPEEVPDPEPKQQGRRGGAHAKGNGR